MSNANDVLRGLPKFVELEIAKAVKPLEERVEQLENQLRALQPAKKPGLIKRLMEGSKG